jgi:SPP1 gp7 family putative phage head morphogenesis protein
VHELTLRGLENSSRASEIVAEIKRTGDVSIGRAKLIARTETSRTASVMTQARAQRIGSTGYIWRTAHDSDVRGSHKHMNGEFVRWDSPPTLDDMTGHAGCLPNCRCYPEPVIPDD